MHHVGYVRNLYVTFFWAGGQAVGQPAGIGIIAETVPGAPNDRGRRRYLSWIVRILAVPGVADICGGTTGDGDGMRNARSAAGIAVQI